MMRLPTGKRSSRKPSPCQKRVGGVDRSTSRTKPGRGTTSSSLAAQVEGDLHRAPPTGVGCVFDGFPPPFEWVERGHQAVETGVLYEVEGLGEVVIGVCVGTSQRHLAVPQRREVDAHPAGHAE